MNSENNGVSLSCMALRWRFLDLYFISVEYSDMIMNGNES